MCVPKIFGLNFELLSYFPFRVSQKKGGKKFEKKKMALAFNYCVVGKFTGAFFLKGAGIKRVYRIAQTESFNLFVCR